MGQEPPLVLAFSRYATGENGQLRLLLISSTVYKHMNITIHCSLTKKSCSLTAVSNDFESSDKLKQIC